MTIRVIIKHTQPNYDKHIKVSLLNKDGTVVKQQPIIFHAGEKLDFYVYDNQQLLVTEHTEGE